jgi:hypothetical protein
MSKRPTPKKRRAKSAGRSQHSEYQSKQIKKMENKQASPFATVAKSKKNADKALKSITRIKA